MEILRTKGILLDLMMDHHINKEDQVNVEKLCKAAVQLDIFWSLVNQDCEIVFDEKNNIDNCRIVSKCLQIDEKINLSENLKGNLKSSQEIEDFIYQYYKETKPKIKEKFNQTQQERIETKVHQINPINNQEQLKSFNLNKKDDLNFTQPYIRYDRLYPPNLFDQPEVFPEPDPNKIFNNVQPSNQRSNDFGFDQPKSTDFFGHPKNIFK